MTSQLKREILYSIVLVTITILALVGERGDRRRATALRLQVKALQQSRKTTCRATYGRLFGVELETKRSHDPVLDRDLAHIAREGIYYAKYCIDLPEAAMHLADIIDRNATPTPLEIQQGLRDINTVLLLADDANWPLHARKEPP